MSLTYRCEVCDGEPMWRLDRRGDAVVSWACRQHLSAVLIGLQRYFEVTEIVVRLMSRIEHERRLADGQREIG